MFTIKLSVVVRFSGAIIAPSDAPTATTADGAYGVEWNYSNSASISASIFRINIHIHLH